MSRTPIAAALSVLLAGSASGAVGLVVSPNPVTVDDQGRFTLDFALDNPDGQSVWGYGLRGRSLPPRVCRVRTRSNLNPIIFTAFDWSGPYPPIGPLFLEDIPDFGAQALLGSDTKAPTIPLVRLGLDILPGTRYPVTLTFESVIADVDFIETFLTPVSVIVLPEPAGLVLLAAAAAWRPRRRSA